MATIQKKMSKSEVDELVSVYLERKKTTPKMDRIVTYKLYNEFFPMKQRDVNACTCMDRDTDTKVAKYLENNYTVEEPLPIESTMEIDMSSMLAPKPKKRGRPKGSKNKTNDESTID